MNPYMEWSLGAGIVLGLEVTIFVGGVYVLYRVVKNRVFSK